MKKNAHVERASGDSNGVREKRCQWQARVGDGDGEHEKGQEGDGLREKRRRSARVKTAMQCVGGKETASAGATTAQINDSRSFNNVKAVVIKEGRHSLSFNNSEWW